MGAYYREGLINLLTVAFLASAASFATGQFVPTNPASREQTSPWLCAVGEGVPPFAPARFADYQIHRQDRVNMRR
jgi:hypothetical protein